MQDVPQSVPVHYFPLMGIGPRMAQLGFDELKSAMGVHAKLIERDRAAARHACEALVQASTANVDGFLQTWRTLVHEYVAASEAVWNDEIAAAVQNEAAFSTLLRDVVIDWEKAWTQAPDQVPKLVAAVPLATDWTAYFGRLAGATANGEARPGEPVHQPASNRA
jgi:hypothetical protein